MGYAARASNGESPRELTDRKFKHVAAVTIDRHAGAIGQLVEAINITNDQARVSREFVADLSVRLDVHDVQIAELHNPGTLLGRLRWLFLGK
jgi:hypothetical protein